MLCDDDDHVWHSLLSMGNQMTVIHKQSEIDGDDHGSPRCRRLGSGGMRVLREFPGDLGRGPAGLADPLQHVRRRRGQARGQARGRRAAALPELPGRGPRMVEVARAPVARGGQGALHALQPDRPRLADPEGGPLGRRGRVRQPDRVPRGLALARARVHLLQDGAAGLHLDGVHGPQGHVLGVVLRAARQALVQEERVVVLEHVGVELVRGLRGGGGQLLREVGVDPVRQRQRHVEPGPRGRARLLRGDVHAAPDGGQHLPADPQARALVPHRHVGAQLPEAGGQLGDPRRRQPRAVLLHDQAEGGGAGAGGARHDAALGDQRHGLDTPRADGVAEEDQQRPLDRVPVAAQLLPGRAVRRQPHGHARGLREGPHGRDRVVQQLQDRERRAAGRGRVRRGARPGGGVGPQRQHREEHPGDRRVRRPLREELDALDGIGDVQPERADPRGRAAQVPGQRVQNVAGVAEEQREGQENEGRHLRPLGRDVDAVVEQHLRRQGKRPGGQEDAQPRRAPRRCREEPARHVAEQDSDDALRRRVVRQQNRGPRHETGGGHEHDEAEPSARRAGAEGCQHGGVREQQQRGGDEGRVLATGPRVYRACDKQHRAGADDESHRQEDSRVQGCAHGGGSFGGVAAQQLHDGDHHAREAMEKDEKKWEYHVP